MSMQWQQHDFAVTLVLGPCSLSEAALFSHAAFPGSSSGEQPPVYPIRNQVNSAHHCFHKLLQQILKVACYQL